MGDDKIRHLRTRLLAGGKLGFFWVPSATIVSLGLECEALGQDPARARARAVELNNLADELRRGGKSGANGEAPGTFSRLVKAYMGTGRRSINEPCDETASDEFKDLKPKTQKGYTYLLGKIELEFGHLPVAALTPRVIKAYYKRIRREVSVTWAYNILAMLRTVLSWAVSEDWITDNPALKVAMKSPPKRKVVWEIDQANAYVAKAHELGLHSVAVMALVLDSIAQSPIDVRTMLRGAYDGRAIHHARTKTGVSDAPIPLFPDAKVALDKYLSDQPKLPTAPMFLREGTAAAWDESALNKAHVKIRRAAKLPDNLQLQDFRRTAQTEAGAGGGTEDEIRALARHTTRAAGEHYVIPDSRYVEAAQNKRLAVRNGKRAKVETPNDEC